MLILGTISESTPLYVIQLSLIFQGVGMGTFNPPNQSSVLATVNLNRIGVATAFTNMVRNTANLQAGQSIAVFGAGGIGLSAIMAAASAGAALIAAIDVTAQNCPARATPARLQRSTPGPKTRLPPSTP